MEFLSRSILTFAGNLVALVMTTYWDPAFQVLTDVNHLIPLVFTLSIINMSIRPLLKLFFGPLIFITFGIFNILLNAGILYVIDIYSGSITINGLWALVLGAHLIGLTNVVLYYASYFVYGQQNLS